MYTNGRSLPEAAAAGAVLEPYWDVFAVPQFHQAWLVVRPVPSHHVLPFLPGGGPDSWHVATFASPSGGGAPVIFTATRETRRRPSTARAWLQYAAARVR